MLPRPLWIALTIMISLCWLANVVIGFIDLDRAQPAINLIFGAVAGTLYIDRPGVRKATRDKAKAIADGVANAAKKRDGDGP